MNDLNLLTRISKGDAKAFEQVMREYHPPLLGLVTTILRDRAAAEDVVQEVFLHLWRQRTNSIHIKSLRNYLYVCTYHLAMNYIRSEERLKERQNKFVMEEKEFAAQVVKEETLRLLAEAIDALPARSSMVIKLTIQGLSLSEIAESMQVSINTVKSTKAYAINKIRKKMNDGED